MADEEKKDSITTEIKTDPVKIETAPTTSFSSPSTTKRLSWKKILFVGIAVILLILIILILTNVIKLKPETTGSVIEQEKIDLTYNIYSDKLLDSGTQTFTKDSIASSLGLASNKLDQEIDSMQIGEEKNITLEPKDAYGAYDSGLVFTYERVLEQNRTNEMNRTIWVPISDFTSTFNEQPILNEIYNLSGMPWPYKVIDLNTTDVELSQEAILNQEIPYGTFTNKVIEVTDDIIKLRLEGNDTVIPTQNGDYAINFTENEMIITFTPQIGQEIELTNYPKAKVTGMNATAIFLDANPENAGKTITVQAKIVDIKIEKVKTTGSAIKNIPGAPTMQVFIMSHCPYGTQIVKGLLPVWKAFMNKANIELRFVSYTMHGAQEDLDNNRIMCIREEQSSKLIDYLDCYVHADGTESGAQGCISSVGIDKTKLDSCVANNAATYYAVDKELNTQYNVQGSPTVILDGKEASIYPRDPQSIANALCAAFTTKPSECSQSFSTTNPAAGFGPDGTSGSSGTNASCG
jgi:FKBP-type peptidyl-prolyl cis-trans isomerase 2